MGTKRSLEITELCDRCVACERSEDETLYELAHMDDKNVQNVMNECKQNMKGLQEKAWEQARRRLEAARAGAEGKREALREANEEFSHKLLEELMAGTTMEDLMEQYMEDEARKELEQQLTMMEETQEGIEPEDVRNSLKEYVENDLIEMCEDGIRITPKGSNRLARYVLRKIWENLSVAHPGAHDTRREGFGVTQGFEVRKYEHGDEFHRIDLEATLMSALERRHESHERIEFEEDDLCVRESAVDTRLCIGMIVDESGSMSGEKIHAAMDISVALAELINRNSKDRMKLFLFSNQVREIPQWDILNTTFSGGTTDIRSALRRFRTTTSYEKGERQVYLITDTEPNCEDGKYIGFEKATMGVLREAMVYQREGITLNIIMLDSTPHLREFATILAKRNLGRVFFAEPKDLGKVLVEDYLRSRNKQKLRRAR